MSVWIHFIKDCSPFPGCPNDPLQTDACCGKTERERVREGERETGMFNRTQRTYASWSLLTIYVHACAHTYTLIPLLLGNRGRYKVLVKRYFKETMEESVGGKEKQGWKRCRKQRGM